MRPIRTISALFLCESEEYVVTSSSAKSAEANQKRTPARFADRIVWSGARGRGSSTKLWSSTNARAIRGKWTVCYHVFWRKSGKSGYTHIAKKLFVKVVVYAKQHTSFLFGAAYHTTTTWNYTMQVSIHYAGLLHFTSACAQSHRCMNTVSILSMHEHTVTHQCITVLKTGSKWLCWKQS